MEDGQIVIGEVELLSFDGGVRNHETAWHSHEFAPESLFVSYDCPWWLKLFLLCGLSIKWGHQLTTCNSHLAMVLQVLVFLCDWSTQIWLFWNRKYILCDATFELWRIDYSTNPLYYPSKTTTRARLIWLWVDCFIFEVTLQLFTRPTLINRWTETINMTLIINVIGVGSNSLSKYKEY